MPGPVALPDPPLRTEQFELRPFAPDDYPAVIEAGRDPAITNHTFMPLALMRSDSGTTIHTTSSAAERYRPEPADQLAVAV